MLSASHKPSAGPFWDHPRRCPKPRLQALEFNKCRYPRAEAIVRQGGIISKRKVLTRAESQAITRESLLDAGEELLLERGYHSTSLAAIATAAGRTIGAVYSNYASKEDLCLAIIKRRSADEITALMSDLAESEDSVEARLEVVGRRWAAFSSDSRQVLLAAEYALTAMRQPEQRERTKDAAERTLESVRILIEDHLPADAQDAAAAALDRAVHGIVATGVGLASLQTIGQLDAEESARTLVDVIRMWLDRTLAEAETSFLS